MFDTNVLPEYSGPGKVLVTVLADEGPFSRVDAEVLA
jgi:hypothetical protein